MSRAGEAQGSPARGRGAMRRRQVSSKVTMVVTGGRVGLQNGLRVAMESRSHEE